MKKLRRSQNEKKNQTKVATKPHRIQFSVFIADDKDMKFRILLILLFVSSAAFSVDWEARYKEVCQVDKEYCRRLKNPDGTWMRVKPEINQLLKDQQVQTYIKSAAAKYKVDPTAIAGAIAAENSLNVGVADSVQNFLASKMGITKLGSHSFSVGLGQIGLPAAMEAERYIAKIENRAPRSSDEMTKEILDTEGSIKVAAQIIRKAQDDYKAQGIDISNKPEILATLYNLGKTEERAKKSKESGTLPQANYFGLFVEKYAPEIQASTGIGKKTAPTASTSSRVTATAPAAPVAAVAPSSVPATAAAPVEAAKSNVKTSLREVASISLPLVNSPDSCKESDYGQDVRNKYKNYQAGIATGVLEKQNGFKVLSTKFGCNTTSWVLVRGDNGVEGWIKKETLEANKEKALVPDVACSDNSTDKKCQTAVTKAVGDRALDTKKGLLYLKPNASAANAGFEQEDESCSYGKKAEENPRAVGTSTYVNSNGTAVVCTPSGGCINQMPSTSQPATQPSAKEMQDEAQAARRIVRAIDDKFKEMEKAVGISRIDIYTPENPYNSAASLLNMQAMKAQKCATSSESENMHCGGFLEKEAELLAAIKKLSFEKDPSLESANNQMEDLQKTIVQVNDSAKRITSDYYAATEQEISKYDRDTIVTSLKECEERKNNFEENLKKKMQALQPGNNSSSTAMVTMKGGLGWGWGGYGAPFDMKAFVDAAEKLDTGDFDKRKRNFISMGKFCAARFNALEGKQNASQNPITCTGAPKFINLQDMNVISQKVYGQYSDKYPEMVLYEINNRLEAYGERLGQAVPNANNNTALMRRGMKEYSPDKTSFCPNVTAEFVEDLVKSNPCIRRVYMPSLWVTKRLNDLGDKILLREFDKPDRYAIDFGGGTCGK